MVMMPIGLVIGALDLVMSSRRLHAHTDRDNNSKVQLKCRSEITIQRKIEDLRNTNF